MRASFVPTGIAALFVACTPSQTERPAGGDGGAAVETGMSGADTASSGTATGEGAASVAGILSRLELANTAEIQTSKLAVEQAQSPEVKRIARQLVADHGKNRAELEALAKRKGVDILPPEGGNTARDTSGVQALKGLRGAAFDTAFVAGQIEAHNANIDAIRTQMLPAANDPDVRQYLEKTQAAMEKHLASLQQAQGRLES